MSQGDRDLVVVVDSKDVAQGTMRKMDAHKGSGHLHRAISVCLFDLEGRVLLQQRSTRKYHFRGRWSNSCCTHPRPGEPPLMAAIRRVSEELGVPVRQLTPAGSFIYRAEDPHSGLVEWELDHVFAGLLTGTPAPDRNEISDLTWHEVDDDWLPEGSCEAFTPWLPRVVELAYGSWTS